MAEIPATRASLLLRLRDPRDQAAWAQFVDLYTPLVYHYARKQGLQDADAADLTQEVLCALAGAVGRLEYDPHKGAFRNWLFTLVRRKLSNWRRGRKNRVIGSGDSGTQQLLQEHPLLQEDRADWETDWERQLFAWACTQVRRDVADSTWQAFWRTAVEGQSTQQVASDLGLTASAIYLARRRVLLRLKELVQSVQELEEAETNHHVPS